MDTSEKLIVELRRYWSPTNDFDIQSIRDFDMNYYEDMERIRRNMDETSPELSEDLREYYNVMCYIQNISHFNSAVCWDGLVSIFYNDKGKIIEEFRELLVQYSDPISPFFEEAYELLAPVYGLELNTNWSTRSAPDSNPYELLPSSVKEKIEILNAKISSLLDGSLENAIQQLKSLG